MKKLVLLSVLGLGAAIAPATANAESFALAPAAAGKPESLFQRGGRPDAKVGWYVAPTSGFTSFDGRLGYVAGARAALVLNRTWGFGLAGNVLGTERTHIDDDNAREIGAYGGTYVQYILRSNSVVHAFADVTGGMGGWCPKTVDDECDGQKFGFLEPTANLELNVFQNVRLSTGVGYRFAIADKDDGLSSRQLSGIVARSSLVFGMF